MGVVDRTHTRIIALMAPRVGVPAAELEYQYFLNRLYLPICGVLFVMFGLMAEYSGVWAFLIVSILSAGLMIAIFIRGFVIRHRFFNEVSRALGYRVTFRHPVRGLPNWRRSLSPEVMERLNAQYSAWCEARGIRFAHDLGGEPEVK